MFDHLSAQVGRLEESVPPILIYQMGKVGSSTVKASLEKMRLPNPIFFSHFLSREGLERMETYHENNASRLPYPYHLIRAEKLRDLIDETAGAVRWKVITLVREPIARAVSDIFENIGCRLPDASRLPEDEVLGSIEKIVSETLENFDEKSDYVCTWFDSELKDVFQFDVYAADFDRERGYGIYEAPHSDILVLKLEKLSACCREAFRQFLGIQDFVLADHNVGAQKWYKTIYRRVRDSLAVPENVLDRIYRSRYCRKFYTDAEIDDFRDKYARKDA